MSRFNTLEMASQINLRKDTGGHTYYRITGMRQLDSKSTLSLLITIEEIAFRPSLEDTIRQTTEGEYEQLVFYPMEETLKDVLEDEDYEILDSDFNPSVLSLEGNGIQLSEIQDFSPIDFNLTTWYTKYRK